MRGGAWVTASIWLEQIVGDDGELLDEPKYRCEVDGRPRDAVEEWNWLAGNVISEEEYRRLTLANMKAKRTKPTPTGPAAPIDWFTKDPP